MKKKTWIPCVSLILTAVCLLHFASLLLEPKYMEESREGALISEYYNEESFSHDVLFIGDCEVYESFTPPTLWEEYGITSYIRGSAQQLAWHSYYLLKDSLRYETPRVVVFNVLSLKYGEPQKEEYNRMTLDGMELSSVKLEAISDSMLEEESFASYIFPILRWHSRWQDLSGEDFTYMFSRDRVSHNGYLMQTAVKGGKSESKPAALFDYTLPAQSMEYLEKMRVLCEENSIEFVLIKAPTNDWKYHWYDEWDAQIVSYAAQHDLHYYNFISKADEIGIDWNTDTYDAGVHLNVYGAEKLTSYFGKLLQDEFRLPDNRVNSYLCTVWGAKLDAYYTERNSSIT